MNLLQEVFGAEAAKVRELQFTSSQVAQVASDDEAGAAGHRQLDDVVVALIGQIGPPCAVDARPFSGGQRDVQEFAAP